MKVTEGLGLTTSNGKITRSDLGFVRVQRSTFAEALGFTTLSGKMSGEGAVMSCFLEVLLAAIFERAWCGASRYIPETATLLCRSEYASRRHRIRARVQIYSGCIVLITRQKTETNHRKVVALHE